MNTGDTIKLTCFDRTVANLTITDKTSKRLGNGVVDTYLCESKSGTTWRISSYNGGAWVADCLAKTVRNILIDRVYVV